MLSIKLDNDKELWLYEDTNVRFEMVSPLFEDGVIPQGVVYPFDVPAAPNQKTLMGLGFIEVNRTTRAYDCSFEFTFLLFSGKLLVNKVDKHKYRCSIVVNKFSVDFKNKKLPELDYGGDITIGGSPHSSSNVLVHANDVVKGNVDADYQFPKVYAPEFYGENDDNGFNEKNKDFGQGGTGKFLNNYYPINESFQHNNITEGFVNKYTLVPFPKLPIIFEKVLRNEEYNVFGDFLKHNEIQKLLIMNNFPLDDAPEISPMYRFYGEEINTACTNYELINFSQNQEDPDNLFDDPYYNIPEEGTYTFEIDVETDYIEGATQMIQIIVTPEKSTSFFLVREEKAVPEDGKLHISADIYATTEMTDDMFVIRAKFESDSGDVNYTIYKATMKIVNRDKSVLNYYANKLNLKNHVPNIKVSEFLNSLKDTFQLAVWIDDISKEIQIGFKRDIIKNQNYLDLSDKLIIDDYEIELQETEGMEFNLDVDEDTIKSIDEYEYFGTYDKWDLPDGNMKSIAFITSLNKYIIFNNREDENGYQRIKWRYYSQGQYPVKINGDEIKKIHPKLSSTNMAFRENNKSYMTTTPEYHFEASSPAFSTGNNDFDFQIVLYHGMQPNGNGNNYPFASCMRYDYNGNEIGTLNLKAQGDKGIFETFHRDWYEFTKRKEVMKAKFACDVNDMFNIMKLFRPQHVNEVRKVRAAGLNWIPKKFTFMLSFEGIKECQAELVKEGGIEI